MKTDNKDALSALDCLSKIWDLIPEGNIPWDAEEKLFAPIRSYIKQTASPSAGVDVSRERILSEFNDWQSVDYARAVDVVAAIHNAGWKVVKRA